MSLTVIVLVHQQTPVLTHCLAALKFADEVMILDNNSGVEWKTWQEKLPLTIVKVSEKITDFSATRNQGLEKATTEWVLFVDSDEVVTPESINEIQSCVTQKNIDGFYIHRRDVFLDKELRFGEVGSVKMLRLFKTAKGKYHRRVHEEVRLNGTVALSSIKVLHYAHQSISTFFDKITRYAEIEAASRPRYTKNQVMVEILVYPAAKFIQNFIVRLGFVDGWRGLIYAVLMSCHSLCVRVFAYEKSRST